MNSISPILDRNELDEVRSVVVVDAQRAHGTTLFIDGQWQAAARGGTRTIVCPADGAEVGVVAEATAEAIRKVAEAIRQPGGQEAVQLKVAEKAVDAYAKVAADATTTLIVPSNMTEVSTLIASAMKMVGTSKTA